MKNRNVNLHRINFLKNYKISTLVMGVNIWTVYRYKKYKGPHTIIKDIKPFINNAIYVETHNQDTFLNIYQDKYYKILEKQKITIE